MSGSAAQSALAPTVDHVDTGLGSVTIAHDGLGNSQIIDHTEKPFQPFKSQQISIG